MITRAALVDAAKDLNKVLDLSPAIDVKLGVNELKIKAKEAAELLRDSDKITDATRKVIDELSDGGSEDGGSEDGEVIMKVKAPKAAKAAKTTAPKAPKELKGNPRMEDSDVTEFIQERLPLGAQKILRELRGAGHACSQQRFHPLYKSAKAAA